MGKLNEEDLKAYFKAGNTGFWKLECEEGKEPKLYTDEIMGSLIGTSDDMTAEERYQFFCAHIHSAEKTAICEFLEKLKIRETEITYRYAHPERGCIVLRCTGRSISFSEKTIRIVGYQQEVADMEQSGKSELFEDNLLSQNRELEKEQNSYYRGLMDKISFGVLSYTLPDYKIIHMNQEALRIFGMKNIEEAQENLGEIVQSVKYLNPDTTEKLKELRHHNHSVHYECLIPNGQGNVTHALAKTEIFFTPDGTKTTITTFMDISENIILKNTLAEKEVKNEIISSISKMFKEIVVIDLETKTYTLISGPDNQFVQKGVQGPLSQIHELLLTRNVGECSRKQIEEFVNFDTLPDRMKYKTVISKELRAISGKWYEASFIAKKRDAKGRVTHVLMAVHDINELKEQELTHQIELQNSYQKLSKAMEEVTKQSEIIKSIATLYDTILYEDLKNGTFEIITAGDRLSVAIGTSGKIDESHGQKIKTAFGLETEDKVDDLFNPVILSEKLNDTNSVFMEYKGIGEHWYRAGVIAKKRDKVGNVEEVLFISREITKEKKRQFEYQEELKKTAQDAKKANASKTDFLRRMSHDIRTPINGIRGIVQIANHFPEDLVKQQECRDKVMTASGFLLNLVNDILDMNKMESGMLELEEKPFDLLETIHASASIVEMQGREKGISLSSTHGEILHDHLIGSPVHFQQILQNIGNNAVKYNRKGGKVAMNCREISSNEQTAVFEFTCADNGLGIGEEFQKHIFEPFAQENPQITSSNTGSGLGLAIVKQLVEMMNGSIHFSSKLNEGTTFVITLPFHIDTGYTAETQMVDQDISLEGMRVLLVEDNELNMEIAQFILENEKMQVICAWNGKEAVDLFAQSAPGEYDLILTDIMMPVMDGLVATEIIRAMDRQDAKKIPIVAMSANAFSDDIERSRQAGMDSHLTKPLTGEVVVKELKRLMHMKKNC